jgi:hypothetical protein
MPSHTPRAKAGTSTTRTSTLRTGSLAPNSRIARDLSALMCVETSGRKGHRVPQYVCHRYLRNGTCTNTLRVNVGELDEAVLYAIEEHALTPEAVEQVVSGDGCSGNRPRKVVSSCNACSMGASRHAVRERRIRLHVLSRNPVRQVVRRSDVPPERPAAGGCWTRRRTHRLRRRHRDTTAGTHDGRGLWGVAGESFTRRWPLPRKLRKGIRPRRDSCPKSMPKASERLKNGGDRID